MAFSAYSKTVIFLMLLSVALCHTVSAQSDAAQIVTGINTISQLSANLNGQVNLVTFTTALDNGANIGSGFDGITAQVTSATLAIQTGLLTSDLDCQSVVGAVTTFVQVQQTLLTLLIGKHELLTLIGYFETIRVSLVNMEAAVDAFAYKLIYTKLLPTEAQAAKTQFDAFDTAVALAISTYANSFPG